MSGTLNLSGPLSGYRFDQIDGRLVIVDTNDADGNDGTVDAYGYDQVQFSDRAITFDDIGVGPSSTLVNTATAGKQIQPSVGYLADGFVVTWVDVAAHCMKFQRFDVEGQRAGPETSFDAAVHSSIVTLNDGSFIVVGDTNGESGRVFAAHFDQQGVLISETFPADIGRARNHPDIVALTDGGYAVAWYASDVDGMSVEGTCLRRFAADGTPSGDGFFVSSTSFPPDARALADAKWPGEVSTSYQTLPGGGSVSVWEYLYDVYAEVLDADGFPIHPEVYGSADGDSMRGGAASQVFHGLAGADTLDGGVGADTMIGGAGDDIYFIDDAGDVVDELSIGSSGKDTVNSYLSVNLTSSTQIRGAIENVTLLGSGNIDVVGSAVANVLIGNSGKNRLDGGAGVDIMSGGNGDDTYVVDDPHDRIDETGGDGLDTVISSISFNIANSTRLLGLIENLTLAADAGNINGTGNSLANVLTGNSGNNILNGSTNTDTMIGGAGNDTYYVDNVGDQVIEGNVAGIDQVYSSVSMKLGSQYIENLTLTGSTNINATGNSLANVLTGNSGSNVLNGSTGVDTMVGGSGSDTYYVDTAGDRVIEGNVAGVDLVLSSVSMSLGPQYIENLTLTGAASINATGNSLANVLKGNSGNNVLAGGDGLDTLAGGAGNDAFLFSTTPTASNVDNVTDYSAPADTIWLSRTVFAAITGTGTLTAAQFVANATGAATTADQHIIYNTMTGQLFYDINGNRSGGSTLFAIIDNHATAGTITNLDFVIV